MSKKRSNRPFHGHGSIEEEFEFEEVAMSDEPKGNARGGSRKKAPKPSSPSEEIWANAEVMDEKEIDAVVAEINNAQPKIKKSRRRGARKEQHIAANPSVNPTQTRTSIIDGVKIANTRLRVSVEDEMKTHGIKKLPNGMSAADLAIPSYDSVVTAAERRPLDCALYHEYADGELSPLEQMMRKSAERSEKSKKKGQKAREEKDSKQEKKAEKKPEKEKKDCKTCDGFHGCKGCRKAEKYAQAKAAENAGEKTGKQGEKEQPKPEKRERNGKKSRGPQPQVQPQPAAAAPVAGSIPAPIPPVTQVQPAFYQTQAQGMDAHRAELLKQQEMVLNMIQQCHQTLASIQAQLLQVVPQPMIQPVVTPVAVPVPAPIPTVQTVPVQTSVLESRPSDAAEPAPAPVSENVSPTEGSTASVEEGKPERKTSRRERFRTKKQREAQALNESETSEKAGAEEKASVSQENQPAKKPEKKPENNSGKKAENQNEKPGNKKPAKFVKGANDSKDSKDSRKSFSETSISDVISAHPEDFIGPEDFDEEFNSDSADHKKKVKKPFMVWKKPKKR